MMATKHDRWVVQYRREQDGWLSEWMTQGETVRGARNWAIEAYRKLPYVGLPDYTKAKRKDCARCVRCEIVVKP